VVVDAERRIVAGHGRVAAARQLGMDAVPVIRIEDLSEDQIRAYRLADNQLAAIAGWDEELLATELQHLCEFQIEFDPRITGFTTAEIDLRISSLDARSTVDEADRLPDIGPDAGPVSRRGDLWILGPHRLLCGDATRPEDFARLLDGERAQLVFTDPPYNVPVDGHVCGLGGVQHAEFAMASGEMSGAEFTAFLETVMRNLARSSTDGSIHFVCMDWRHLYEALTASRAVYGEMKNLCVWNKTNGGMGSLYRSKHELVLVLKNGTAPHINNVALGKHGRYRTNVWDHAGISSFGKGRREDLEMHPTVKPVALVAEAIQDCSDRGGIVLDPFAGSGTTLIAAMRTGRCARVMEIDPGFVDLAIRRFETLTGETARHLESGLTFAQMCDWRVIEGPEVDVHSRSNSEGEEVIHV
jgi:DNA modification methylase